MSEKNKEKKNMAEEAAAAEAISSENAETGEETERLTGIEVIKKQNAYPVYAFIMCIGAAIGHLLGTYVFDDLMTCTAVGMGAGILAAFLYSKKLTVSADEEKEA